MAFKEMTKAEAKREILKSRKDPQYFIKKFVKIPHPLRGMIPFALYPFQEELLEHYMGTRSLSILKARQLGISTLTAAYIVWYMMFHEERNIMVIATKQKTAINVVKKVKKMYRTLPNWLRKTYEVGERDNLSEFELANGSSCFASTTSGDAGRSEALSLLVIDEAAHVDGLDGLMTAMAPTLSTGGRAIVLSTPNGAQGWFYKNHQMAENGSNNYEPIVLPWTVHPERDEEWFESQKKELLFNEQAIAQEHLCSFTATGATVIDPKRITEIQEGSDNRERELREPLYKDGPVQPYEIDGITRPPEPSIWVWEEYDYVHSYIMTADVATGDGGDYSTFQVIDQTTGEQVAEAMMKAPHLDFANYLVIWGRTYGNCPIIVERNGIGLAVCTEVERMDYSNLYYTRNGAGTFHPRWEAEGRTGYEPGIYMNSGNRPLIINKFVEYVSRAKFRVRSERLTNEMRSFIYHNRKEQAGEGSNDDLIMAFAVACYADDTMEHVNRDASASREGLDMIYTVPRSRRGYTDMSGYDPTNLGIVYGKDKAKAKAKESSKYGWVLK